MRDLFSCIYVCVGHAQECRSAMLSNFFHAIMMYVCVHILDQVW